VRLIPERLTASDLNGTTIGTVRVSGSGTYQLGPLSVDLNFEHTATDLPAWTWSVANAGDEPVSVWSVSLVLGVEYRGPLRIFRHGYQSWSSCDVATLGVHRDPSLGNTTGIELIQGVHHADQRNAAPDELRSEFVTVLADANVPAGPLATGAIRIGFDAGVDHDGTFRLRASGAERAELRSEAFLGGARLDPGVRFGLHGVSAADGKPSTTLLADWARRVGALGAARTSAAFQVGWCSWYHYFHDVTEADLRSNLAASGSWPFDVFQLDDGFQAAIGDWLVTNNKFPSDLAGLAQSIAAEGHTPGLWLAPFIAAPDSQVVADHPEWVATTRETGGPLPGMLNPPWGGGMDGLMFALDTTHPDVLAHLEDLGRQVRDAGYDYLKLDFTFAPSFDGAFWDPTMTPAQRVRAGYDAVRRGAGEDAFILGCGAPLSHVVGVVDGNRIGSDVDPRWHPRTDDDDDGQGYPETMPATVHAFRNTLARSFMHRSLWLNDPDCVMLRTTETDLDPAAVRTWARTVALSGGMVLVSDDLALLGPDARQLLDEVVTLGRAVDAASLAMQPARCDDLLDANPPTTLSAGSHELVVDVATGHGVLDGVPQ
jgi:alpha-galactosidase